MQVTRAGEYAIIGLLYLAKQPAERTIMIDEISEAEGVPKSFLAKIFQSLAKGSFVRSHRGAGGGFSLAGPPPKSPCSRFSTASKARSPCKNASPTTPSASCQPPA